MKTGMGLMLGESAFSLWKKGSLKMSVDLRTMRFFANINQAMLSQETGIHQSKLSLAENGLTKLNEGEKMKIVSVLGGKVDWKQTENQNKDYNMVPQKEYPDPEEAYNRWLRKEKGLKIVYGDPDTNEPPKLVPADEDKV